MLNNTDSEIKTLDKEQKLSKVLTLLDPPLDQLAYETSQFLSTFREPSIERVLAAYFELFAYGYTLWDSAYYYSTIHEYFYGGYLQATQIADSLPSSEPRELLDMLEKLSRALIAFTWYESAVARNDPKAAFDSTHDAIQFMERALESLSRSSLAPQLKGSIQKYLENNLSVLYGLQHCAKIFLDVLQNKNISLAHQSTVHQLLSGITCQELLTYLRVQYSYMQRFAQAHAHRASDLRVKEGKILLRATGYAGEDLVSALFKRFADPSVGPEEIRKTLCTKLPIKAVRSSYLQDNFDTSLGQEHLQQIIIELYTEGDSSLTFSASDGGKEILYSAETFRVCLMRFGSISVEVGLSFENTSVSHVRTLESLIGPDSIQFDFTWNGAPPDIERSAPNFVDYFLKSQKWVERIQREMSAVGPSTASEMEDVLKAWKNALKKLAASLHHSSLNIESLNKDGNQTEALKSAYQILQDCFLHMYDLADKWLQEASKLGYSESEICKQGNHLFPKGIRFGRLMDIAEEVLRRLSHYLKTENFKENRESSNTKQTHQGEELTRLDDDIRNLIYFDSNNGWSAILTCNKLTIVGRDGRTSELHTKEDHKRLLDHPEFKGLIIQYLASRVSFDDWLFVAAPSYQNLATIRSHENDIMHTDEHRTFLYMPDEPEWVIKQYIETAHFITDIRMLVLTFNVKTRKQLDDLKSFFEDMQFSQQNKISEKMLNKTRHELLLKRNEIEDLRIHAESILGLLRASTISKYQDQSDLLKEAVKESKINDYRDSLEHNIERLNQFHAYLTDLLQQRFDESIQTSQKHITRWLNILTVISAVSGLISAISVLPTMSAWLPTISAWLDSVMRNGRMTQLLKIFQLSRQQNLPVILLVVTLLAFIIFYLIKWARNKKIHKLPKIIYIFKYISNILQ